MVSLDYFFFQFYFLRFFVSRVILFFSIFFSRLSSFTCCFILLSSVHKFACVFLLFFFYFCSFCRRNIQIYFYRLIMFSACTICVTVYCMFFLFLHPNTQKRKEFCNSFGCMCSLFDVKEARRTVSYIQYILQYQPVNVNGSKLHTHEIYVCKCAHVHITHAYVSGSEHIWATMGCQSNSKFRRVSLSFCGFEMQLKHKLSF